MKMAALRNGGLTPFHTTSFLPPFLITEVNLMICGASAVFSKHFFASSLFCCVISEFSGITKLLTKTGH